MNKFSNKKNFLNFFGIGENRYFFICKKIGLNPNSKRMEYGKKIGVKLEFLIKKYTYNHSLKKKIKNVINFYLKLRNYRGLRHSGSYPVRGQRTRTNAKTSKRLKKKPNVLKKNKSIILKKKGSINVVKKKKNVPSKKN